MEEDYLESTVETIISAIAYVFESIRRWDRAVLGLVKSLTCWLGVSADRQQHLFTRILKIVILTCFYGHLLMKA